MHGGGKMMDENEMDGWGEESQSTGQGTGIGMGWAGLGLRMEQIPAHREADLRLTEWLQRIAGGWEAL